LKAAFADINIAKGGSVYSVTSREFMSKSIELGSAVIESLSTESATEIAKEYAEIGLDAVLSEGLLKDIPVVNTLVALGKLGVSINDRILIKKLLAFLSKFQAVAPQKRMEMVRKLESDSAYGRKVGEHVIELLDRIESHLKPPMVALVFKAYLASSIDGGMLHRLNNSIERIPLFEIPNIRRFNDASPEQRLKFNPTSLQAFVSAGLATVGSGYGALIYEPNDACAAFLALNLDRVQS
jgi:hypothetical protein